FTQNGKLGRITPAGVVTDFNLPATFAHVPVGVGVGPDGNIWYVATDRSLHNPDVLGHLAADGSVAAEIAIPKSPDGKEIDPRQLTLGPDGNLWLASIGLETGTGGLVRFKADTSTFDLFPSSHPEAGHFSVASGPDASLWYAYGLAETHANYIAKRK